MTQKRKDSTLDASYRLKPADDLNTLENIWRGVSGNQHLLDKCILLDVNTASEQILYLVHDEYGMAEWRVYCTYSWESASVPTVAVRNLLESELDP